METIAVTPRLYLYVARMATVFGVAMAALASCHASDETWPRRHPPTNDAAPMMEATP